MVHWYYPPQVGGVESLMRSMVEELCKRGHQVTVLAASLGKEKEVSRKGNFTLIRLPSFDPQKKGGKTLQEFKNEIKDLFTKNDFDLVHLHNLFAPLTPLRTLYISEVVMRRNIPLLQHSHCLNPTDIGRMLISLSYDRVIFISHWHRKATFKLDLFIEKSEVLYNGTDPAKFFKDRFDKREIRKKLGIGEEPTIICPARIVNPDGKPTTRKGIDVLLKAFARVKKVNPEFKLILCAPLSYGDENWRIDRIEAFRDLMEEENLKENILLYSSEKGNLPMEQIYAASDIMCQPSVDEPFGLVFIEAMAEELVVIGARDAAIPEIIEEGEDGYMIEPGNDRELAELILRIFKEDKEKLKEMGRKARQKVKDKFSIQKMIDGLEKIYEKVRR
jgi:glycosyltransferase involved in cell wall biosynthesis